MPGEHCSETVGKMQNKPLIIASELPPKNKKKPVMITHQLINLGERGILDMQPICGDTVQSRVIKHHLMKNTEWNIRQMTMKKK